ncbi:ArsR/SmtB family transcription factor [Pseudoalteromonas denitrificans]|jgi:DNA-binding transcriptional ArsR family regulator|uniref:DNA-binding transcriptional regulator, ArsR family n=1 Tax=Pseudoalteromonas denitrificans DSM 6059 TaxID=1123010 RepID=A0A1I1FNP8_9GAMM|nr:metalloregulator ArsR/SmtB family transcription factor [Pseudoalteromonas denitrificans]SFC00616.1 DNA-binding transcriptional regulator, ArsR family [Pseudoalteromonas denitrificans DSM 6059]
MNKVNIDDMQKSAIKAAKILKAMSNESRLIILCHLGMEEMSVTQLNKHVLLSQSSLSQHLAKLRQDGLVKTRRESQTIYYSIADEIVGKIITLLQNEYC